MRRPAGARGAPRALSLALALCAPAVRAQVQPWPMLGANANHSGALFNSYLGPIVTPGAPSLRMSTGPLGYVRVVPSGSGGGLGSPVVGVLANGIPMVFALTVPAGTTATVHTLLGISATGFTLTVNHAVASGGTAPAIGNAGLGYFSDSAGNVCSFPLQVGLQVESCAGPTPSGGTPPALGNAMKLPASQLSSPVVAPSGAVCVTSQWGGLHCAGADLKSQSAAFQVNQAGSTVVNPLGGPPTAQSGPQTGVTAPQATMGSPATKIYGGPAVFRGAGLSGMGTELAVFGVGDLSTQGYVYCVDVARADSVAQSLIWVWTAPAVPDGSGVVTTPVIGSGFAYVVTAKGFAYQLSLATGLLTPGWGLASSCGATYASSILTPNPLLYRSNGADGLALSCVGTGALVLLQPTGVTKVSYRLGGNYANDTCWASAAGFNTD